MDRPRRAELVELRQLVEKQLRGPVADQVKARLTGWNSPAAKLARSKRRAAVATWFFLFLAGLLAVIAAVMLGTASGVNELEEIMGGAISGVVALGSLALGVRSGMRLRALNRTQLPAAAPTLPAARSLAREPMERLAEAERTLADLLRSLSSPRSTVPPESVQQARETGAEAAGALREVAAQLEAVEKARDMAPSADRPALDSGVRRLRDQLDQGLDGYGSLIAAAGHLVAASSTGGPDSHALTDASDRLHGLAVALRELFP